VISGNTATESKGGGFYDDSSGTFSNNYVLSNAGGGIYSQNGESSITGNIIAGNTGGALHYTSGMVSGDRSVSSNTIFNNTGSPVVYLKAQSIDGSLEVKNNTIVGNSGSPTVSLGKRSSATAPVFNYNNIYGNSGTYELATTSAMGDQEPVPGQTGDLNIENNYWGTSDASMIAAKVYDWYEDDSLGFVDYIPFATSLVTSNPIVPPSNVVKEAITGGVKITWTANSESDVAGYKIHYGSGTGYSYTTAVDAGNVTSHEISGLGFSEEVSVTAYDGNADGTDDQVEGYQSWFAVSGDPAAAISLSNASLDYGVVAMGSSQAKTLTLTNSGSANLNITGISSSNDQFSISPSSVTLAAGSSQDISITFTSSAVGPTSSTLTISHNAGSGSSTVNLKAFGYASSGTTVKGIITSDTTLSAANSPYVVVGSVLVSSGVKLTVEAGVEVKFDSGKSLQVYGELIARGTSGSAITFTSAQKSKAAGDWGQIVLYDSSVDASYDGNGDYASGSILEYCTVEYGGGIQLKLANPFINQGTIRYHSGRGIGTDNYNSSNNSATLKITNNTISNNAGGVYLYGLGTVLISGNTISNNMSGSGAGIKIDGGDGVTISGNTIENNVAEDTGGGIGGGSGYQILNNVIKGNQAREGGGIKGGEQLRGM
jgi:parallel beta-helix repeat protein